MSVTYTTVLVEDDLGKLGTRCEKEAAKLVGANDFWIIAGGFAAFLHGSTDQYNDIDIFVSSSSLSDHHFAEMELVKCYNNIKNIVNCTNNLQFIFTKHQADTIEQFTQTILGSFDMDICSVAFYKKNQQWFKCIRTTSDDLQNVDKLNDKRLYKYFLRAEGKFRQQLQDALQRIQN